MVRIQKVTDANEMLSAPRHGMRDFSVDPNFDLKDKAVVVLGNSPALNKVNLPLLDKVFTIGVNRICRVYSPKALLFTDPPILASESEYYKKFTGPILTWHNYEKCWVHDAPNSRFFRLTPTMDPSMWVWPKTLSDPLIRQGTTTAYAIQLAVLMRAKVVGILGIDFSAVQRKVQGYADTHFYGDGFAVQSTGGGGWEPHHQKFYTEVPRWADTYGVKTVNLTPFTDTPINQANWNKMSLEAFIEEYGNA